MKNVFLDTFLSHDIKWRLYTCLEGFPLKVSEICSKNLTILPDWLQSMFQQDPYLVKRCVVFSELPEEIMEYFLMKFPSQIVRYCLLQCDNIPLVFLERIKKESQDANIISIVEEKIKDWTYRIQRKNIPTWVLLDFEDIKIPQWFHLLLEQDEEFAFQISKNTALPEALLKILTSHSSFHVRWNTLVHENRLSRDFLHFLFVRQEKERNELFFTEKQRLETLKKSWETSEEDYNYLLNRLCSDPCIVSRILEEKIRKKDLDIWK